MQGSSQLPMKTTKTSSIATASKDQKKNEHSRAGAVLYSRNRIKQGNHKQAQEAKQPTRSRPIIIPVLAGAPPFLPAR